MSGLIGILQWIIANWQVIATAFSSIMSVALFFMHGNAAADIKLLKQFIDSLQVSQPNGPVDPNSAQAQAALAKPKI